MKPIFMGFCLAAAATAVSVSSCSKKQHENPFLKPYETIYEIPPFEDILIEDYIPAFDAGIAEAKTQSILSSTIRKRRHSPTQSSHSTISALLLSVSWAC